MAPRILVVEDDAALRAVVCRALLDAGYAVREAANGEKALHTLRESPFDLVVTDIIMPDTDGLEIILWLRRFAPGTPIVAVSGYADPLFLDNAAGLGACRTLSKPFRLEELLRIVAELLSCSPLPAQGRTGP
jgi:CheY-like chemotaxis protein